MKLKFLSLFLALGMFVLGSNVNAADPKGVVPAPAEPQIDPSTVITAVCNWITGQTGLPQECSDACTKKSLAGIACCLKSAQANGQIPSALSTTLSALCTAGCNRVACGASGKTGLLTRACGNICCNTTFGSVTNCLKNAGNQTCANFPPDCNMTAATEKAEW